jgi:CRISPR-associated protein Csm2
MEIAFWQDKNMKHIRPDLFSDQAEKIAKHIFSEKSEKLNKPTQIRKFFDEVIRFDTVMKTESSSFESILPYLKMLNAKASYAAGRELVSEGFREFITSSLKEVNDRDDFEAFSKLFESVIGYYKYLFETDKSKSKGGRK